jgi:hypothetical protein
VGHPRFRPRIAPPSFCLSHAHHCLDGNICIVRQQADIDRADGFVPYDLQPFFVQVHLPFVLLDDVLRQKRWPIADEIRLELIQDYAFFVFDEAVDDTVDPKDFLRNVREYP